MLLHVSNKQSVFNTQYIKNKILVLSTQYLHTKKKKNQSSQNVEIL